MKKSILLFMLLVLSATGIFAQQQNGSWCGFVEDPQTREWRNLNHQRPNWQNIPSSRQTYYIPLKFHIVCKDNGTSCYQIDDLLTVLCELNEQFEPSTGFHFFLYDDVEFINSTYFWSYDKDGTVGEELRGNFNVPGVFNAYIVGNVTGLCGRSMMSPRGGGIELIQGCMFSGNTTFAHETGHWFSLPHTFSGWEGTNCYTAVCNPSTLSCWVSDVEYVKSFPDSSDVRYDCYKTGDGFCDTKADYFNDRWGCGLPCNWKDPDGFTIDPRVDSNYMSYLNDACTNKFSDEQRAQMSSYINSDQRSYLLQTPHGSYLPITDAINPTFPRNKVRVPVDWVEFKWDAVPNATHYSIQASRLSTFTTLKFDKVVTGTSYRAPSTYFTTADTGKNIFWRIKPFNPDYTCDNITYSPTDTFVLGQATGLSSVIVANNIGIFPNPVQNNQFHLSVDTDSPFDAKCEIYNMNGEVIKVEHFTFAPGTNDRVVALPNHTSKGIYLLRLTSSGESYFTKIVVM